MVACWFLLGINGLAVILLHIAISFSVAQFQTAVLTWLCSLLLLSTLRVPAVEEAKVIFQCDQSMVFIYHDLGQHFIAKPLSAESLLVLPRQRWAQKNFLGAKVQQVLVQSLTVASHLEMLITLLRTPSSGLSLICIVMVCCGPEY